jgi:hypothetical protein
MIKRGGMLRTGRWLVLAWAEFRISNSVRVFDADVAAWQAPGG